MPDPFVSFFDAPDATDSEGMKRDCRNIRSVSQELGAKNTKNLGNSRKSPSQNRIHPVAVAITRRAGETTRGDFNQYGVLTAEEILNGVSPKEYQNIKLAQLSEFTFIFMAGCVPVAITVQPPHRQPIRIILS